MKRKASSLLPSSYTPLLAELKSRVRTAQVKAALTVNRELILLYWQIGRAILQAQQAEGWGTKVVERLAKDLSAEFPEMGGFSALNLQRMRAFYAAWTSAVPVETADPSPRKAIVSQPVTELQTAVVKKPASPIVSRAVTQLDDPPNRSPCFRGAPTSSCFTSLRTRPRASGMHNRRWPTAGAGPC